MGTCKMCGCPRIYGPSYEKVGSREGLKYRCTKCGYSELWPTMEQEKRSIAEPSKGGMNYPEAMPLEPDKDLQ